ncbi:unnamed protein product [Amoebophrya sp. A120]|nr:unnamed protein product [Amoebophrya sp. A120]|eukprot:GSA120T00002823001.1
MSSAGGPSGGHQHDPRFASQNLGNSLGNRSCVRQTKFFRMYESGNTMKDLLGHSSLHWDFNQKEGAYKGQPIEDPYALGKPTDKAADGGATASAGAYSVSSASQPSHQKHDSGASSSSAAARGKKSSNSIFKNSNNDRDSFVQKADRSPSFQKEFHQTNMYHDGHLEGTTGSTPTSKSKKKAYSPHHYVSTGTEAADSASFTKSNSLAANAPNPQTGSSLSYDSVSRPPHLPSSDVSAQPHPPTAGNPMQSGPFATLGSFNTYRTSSSAYGSGSWQ